MAAALGEGGTARGRTGLTRRGEGRGDHTNAAPAASGRAKTERDQSGPRHLLLRLRRPAQLFLRLRTGASRSAQPEIHSISGVESLVLLLEFTQLVFDSTDVSTPWPCLNQCTPGASSTTTKLHPCRLHTLLLHSEASAIQEIHECLLCPLFLAVMLLQTTVVACTKNTTHLK